MPAVRIGITSPLGFREEPKSGSEVAQHVAALRSVGAEAIVLARGYDTASAAHRLGLQGILFSGGGDVAPDRYGGNATLTDGRVDPVRDEGEIDLFRETYIAGLPILCVCRGLQVANVAFGGTLIEDLPSEFGTEYCVHHHQVRELGQQANTYTHEVRVTPHSRFAEIVGSVHLWTNSMHHQAVRSLAAAFRVAATSEDGVIEAIESKDGGHFFLGVQWHPEALVDLDEPSRRIYAAFAKACTC